MHLWGLSLPFAMATGWMIDARRSIVRLAALQPEAICFGHGGPLTRAPPRRWMLLHAVSLRTRMNA